MTVTISAGWPDDTNTGVQSGVSLTSAVPSGASVDSAGDLVITQAGATIANLKWDGMVIVEAANVTLTNCQINSESWYGVQIKSGVAGAVVENCTITGGGMTDTAQTDGISGQGSFLNNNISNVRTGVVLTGPSTVQGNYIHSLASAGTGASLPHYNGIEIDGGVSNVTINHNTVVNTQGQTDAIMIDNVYGAVSNVTVSNNLLGGGDFTVYDDAHFNNSPITGVSFTNNHMAPGTYGYTDFNGTSPVYTGNVNDGASLIATLDTAANNGSSGSTGTSGSGSTGSSGSGGSTGSTGSSGSSGSTGSTGSSGSPLPVSVTFAALHENSDHTVTMTGTADANSRVKVYDGSTKIGGTNAAADGSWTFTSPSAVSNTIHTYSAQEGDNLGHIVGTSNTAFLGTTGSNTFHSTAGDDLFVGNGHPDTFVFAANFGNDVIQDFQAGRQHDIIEFSKSDLQSFAGVLADAAQVGHDVHLTVAQHGTVTLKNVSLTALHSSDFAFV